ncbi:TPA: type II/IV secretion system ATPase subunit [archaeon]|nr:type II/IV secretion system ATPase subunit [Candidatus Naiadarchaeales archaeon SRR2090153.bin461]HIK02381.1 type II/IV secretion system ATPase subunit [Candidatus Naiadarchaeales archaeon SRR2090159.bin1288]
MKRKEGKQSDAKGMHDFYSIKVGDIKLAVSVDKLPGQFVKTYNLELPKIEPATQLLLERVRTRLIQEVKVRVEEIINPKVYDELRDRYSAAAEKMLKQELPKLTENERQIMVGILINKMLGLGDIEPIFADENVEEIVINGPEQPVWVYHKKQGWLKTNVSLQSDDQIHNFASVIGRRVGREITNLNPLMDARLPSGDRVNATLFPISTIGNTITIRKFARTPWTVIDFIDPTINSLSLNIAALLWFAIENELNLMIAGGTGSGKTSMLNALTPFMPSNQRIISIEDTRELQLPDFLHWIPLATRSPNPEGKGEITMLDLMINSLRMRPDRIIVGEVRRTSEAEVLFEAMHTGHSVYSTIHADNIQQTFRRLTNPPIDVPEAMLEAQHLILVQFRQRRLNIRRTLEVAESVVTDQVAGKIAFNKLYQWEARGDKMLAVNKSKRIVEELTMRTGMSKHEMDQNLREKELVLKWMLNKGIRNITDVGKIVNIYYHDEDAVVSAAKKNADAKSIFNY